MQLNSLIFYSRRFICESTIEQRIEDLQKKKKNIAKEVLTGSGRISNTKLTMNEMIQLLR